MARFAARRSTRRRRGGGKGAIQRALFVDSRRKTEGYVATPSGREGRGREEGSREGFQTKDAEHLTIDLKVSSSSVREADAVRASAVLLLMLGPFSRRTFLVVETKRGNGEVADEGGDISRRNSADAAFGFRFSSRPRPVITSRRVSCRGPWRGRPRLELEPLVVLVRRVALIRRWFRRCRPEERSLRSWRAAPQLPLRSSAER